MKYIFGPVNSRRLGRSLGIDLIPAGICNFDCIYCEIGTKRGITDQRREYSPTEAIIAELDTFLTDPANRDRFDLVTITATGEPTLHPGIGDIIDAIRSRTDKKIAVLTNGSLFYLPEVRQALLGADIVIPSLDAALPESLGRINRPAAPVNIEAVIQGLSQFQRSFKGLFILEILLVEGINDTPEDIVALRQAIDRINPAKVQLNTVVRPPRESSARPLSAEKMHDAAARLGDRVEIIAAFTEKDQNIFIEPDDHTILEMLGRRPSTAEDIRQALGVQKDSLQTVLDRLLKEGRICTTIHHGSVYYRVGRSD